MLGVDQAQGEQMPRALHASFERLTRAFNAKESENIPQIKRTIAANEPRNVSAILTASSSSSFGSSSFVECGVRIKL
jgi:hypothetical protein